MKFDVNLTQEPTSDNLPDQSEDKMFSPFKEIGTANVNDSGKALGRVDDEIVILKHLELTEFLALRRLVQDSFINGLR